MQSVCLRAKYERIYRNGPINIMKKVHLGSTVNTSTFEQTVKGKKYGKGENENLRV